MLHFEVVTSALAKKEAAAVSGTSQVAPKKPRDWIWLEFFAVLATLVAGAVLRYWLSTVVPFDDIEVAVLEKATDPERAMRVPFIMINGVSLLALYVLLRRSAGVGPALAAQLALQASLSFQHEALRVRLWAPVVLLVLLTMTYFRLARPAGRAPRRLQHAGVLLAAALAIRLLSLLSGIPSQLRQIPIDTAADVNALRRAVQACGAGTELPLQQLRSCDIPWPTQRSLRQQEVLWEHQRRLGQDAVAVSAARHLPEQDSVAYVALIDAAGAGFILVPVGPLQPTARRVVFSQH